MRHVLTVRDAVYRYGTVDALRGASLELAAGECLALLGPNGAGKTTIVGLATGLLTPQQGGVEVAGGDPRHASTRRRLGVVQQSVGFPRTLTVREIVRGAAVRAGLPASAAGPALEEAGIAELARRRAGRLSGGQQQRVQLAVALVAAPDLLLLDEPTVGLDITARRSFWSTIAARRDRGTGVLLTTHLVEEAAAVADRVAVLHEGRMVALDTPAGLTALLPDRTITARTVLAPDDVARMPGVAHVRRDGALLVIASTAPESVVHDLLHADPALRDLRVEGASLEQALVHLVGEAERQEVAA